MCYFLLITVKNEAHPLAFVLMVSLTTYVSALWPDREYLRISPLRSFVLLVLKVLQGYFILFSLILFYVYLFT